MINRRKFILAAVVAFVVSFVASTAIWMWNKFPKIPWFKNQEAVSCKRLAVSNNSEPRVQTPGLKEAMFYKKLDRKAVKCGICFKKCVVPLGKKGFCRVRKNRDGAFYSLVYGTPSAVAVDPIEKEPQLHMLPGTEILCIGTVGCNFVCLQCQNWHLSQASPRDLRIFDLPPEKVVELTLRKRLLTISFTYNEPTVLYEYVYDTAVIAKERGINMLWHTNGAMSPGPLRRLLKYTDAITLDLKAFTDRAYRDFFNAELEPVLTGLKIIKQEGIWLEIVNLIIPTVNDDLKDIRKMCEWIKENLGVETPLHFSRFFPAFRLRHLPPTPISTLERAREIAIDVGLHFSTVGNVPGHRHNSTFCPKCGEKLIHRVHFKVIRNNVVDGKCRFCNHRIPGIWRR
ncbi:AmmeMemoRadiSam system radical SAM enzyme [Thermodesulfovibrionales bacterium]|nr:AmmeMemoRadiSam system radical SAM enzyme [Thermodesulfovibrionales bacterium]